MTDLKNIRRPGPTFLHSLNMLEPRGHPCKHVCTLAFAMPPSWPVSLICVNFLPYKVMKPFVLGSNPDLTMTVVRSWSCHLRFLNLYLLFLIKEIIPHHNVG